MTPPTPEEYRRLKFDTSQWDWTKPPRLALSAHQAAAINVALDAAAETRERLNMLEEFLRRMRGWDQMNPPMTGDHKFYASEIDRLLKGDPQ